MDLQKVREALEIGLNAVIMAGQTRYQKDEADEIREALAELERPADDDENDAYDVALGLLSLNNSESTPRRYATVIEQYAESYHARKLAEESAAIIAASAEQARKEAAGRALSFMRERLAPGVFTEIMLDEMNAAIIMEAGQCSE